MSDPIGAAAQRFYSGLTQSVPRVGDTGIRQVPVVPTGSGSFGDTLTRALNSVSDAQDGAADMMGKFLRGENVEMHQVMAATEEAGIALEMLIEIRNKFTEAYRQLTTMQA